MIITEVKKDQATIVVIEGRLDSTSSGLLERKINSLLETGEKNFLVDCAGMDYISSAGLRVLLMAAKKVKPAGGKVVLSALSDNVREVFEIAGFTSIFAIFKTQEEAIQSY